LFPIFLKFTVLGSHIVHRREWNSVDSTSTFTLVGATYFPSGAKISKSTSD